jgi:hypothetical protein
MTILNAPKPVYPFRHIEHKFQILPLIGLTAGGLGVVYYALTTLNGLVLAGLCAVVGLACVLIAYFALLRRFTPVLPHIVGGKKRIIILATEIAFGFAGLAIFGALFFNRMLADEPPYTVDAVVEEVNRPGTRGGWGATFSINGNSYYQAISPEIAQVAMQSQTIVLTLQPGALGYDFILSARGR